MDLTQENKNKIDLMSYRQLLSHWRFAPAGDPWFKGETGKYWGEKIREKRDENPDGAVSDSKSLGWDS